MDPTSGDAFVANQVNLRIERFTAWGEVLRAWGWDVVQSGPGDDTTAPEDQFEICVPANGDVCKEGVAGGGDGEFAALQGVAVDSAGDVYVVDRNNRRVQKFDPDGNFLLTFGGDVNKTKAEALAPEAERNVCPVDPGDVCQAGVQGTGQGQFGAWPVSSFIAIDRGSPDIVYVGDVGRIQKFDAEGAYQGEIAVAGETVSALAVDTAGDLYYARSGKDNVLKIGPAGTSICTLSIERPTAVAASETGEVQVFSERLGGSPAIPGKIGAFDQASCAQTDSFAAEEAGFAASTGLATSSACGIDGYDLFVANSFTSDSFIRIYGPPPDVDLCPPPKVPPTIKAQHALAVDFDGAVVRAGIDPEFWPDTAYYVEYGTGKCSVGGCTEKALFPGSQLGVGTKKGFFFAKGVFLGTAEPLAPDTTYHYRFVAESEESEAGPAFGEDPDGEGGIEEASFEDGLEGTFHTFPLPAEAKVDCPNQAFRLGASAGLPDCRAYEMVSPLDKNNSDVGIPDEGYDASATDGDSATFTVLAAAFGDPLSAPLAPQYLSRRDPNAGWQTASINPPRKLPSLYSVPSTIDPEYRGFTDDLCSGWAIQYTDLALAPGAPSGVPNLYRRRNCGPEEGSFELITTVAPTEPAPGFSDELEPGNSLYFLHPQGSCADGSVSVFRAPARLTPDAANKDLRQVYIHDPEGQLRAVSVPPKGKKLQRHASLGTFQGGLVEYKEDSTYRAVVEDCSRIFWSASAANDDPTRQSLGGGGVGDLPGPLYVRLNPLQPQSALDGANKCTEAEKACTLAISEATNARYLSADTEGKTAIYSEGEALFEFDVAKAIAGQAASTPIAGQVKGILGASEDASRIYLVSGEALAPGASGGANNLYLHERGVGFRLIGILSAADLNSGVSSPISQIPKRRSSRVSPSGLQAAFVSAASLTGYDNTDASSGEADTEVFLYDAEANGGAGQLLCASCNASGARPAGRKVSDGPLTLWTAARLPGWISQTHPGNLLSDDGTRLFFESFEALIPRDTNGRQDVYEWERATSKEACLKAIGGELYLASQGGCLSLISSGDSADDAYLVDASADGRDVFFATSASLLAQDFGLRDLYDARAGGGFPPPPEPEPECEGEACQGAAFNPDDPTPASAAVQGAGNVSDSPPRRPRCAKGKVRRKGRCVARRARKGAKRAKQRQRARRVGLERRASR